MYQMLLRRYVIAVAGIVVRLMVFGFLVLPMMLVIWISFFSTPMLVFPPRGYSLVWYRELLHQNTFVTAFILSCQVALVATVVSLMVGLGASIAITRFRFRGRDALQSLFLAPLVVPAIVTGISMYVYLVRLERLIQVDLVPSFWGLVLAHIIITIPWTVRLIMVGLQGISPDLEEAAMNLGASRWRAFRQVTLPLIRPAIVAAGVFAFISSFGNLEISLMLVGPGQTTLPIEILNYVFWRFDPLIAAVSTVYIIVTAVFMIIVDRLVGLSNVF